jgi:pimeloyl-ACP methyl ester carboxylesterase
MSSLPALPGDDAAHGAAPRFPPGSRYPLLRGVRSRLVTTSRLVQHVYESGTPDLEAVVLIHGNVSSGRFYEEILAALGEYYVVAPDLRGFGASEAKLVDATRGIRDYADDLHALLRALGIRRCHLVGWSLGGNVAMQYVLDHAPQVLSLTLLAPGSPYGYGATRGLDGQPVWPDFAGSGAGIVNPQVSARLRARDVTAASVFSPRVALRYIYVRPPFRLSRQREDMLVEQMLMMALDEHHYPGDSQPSPHWPYTAPGIYGPNNALSPKYCNQSALAELRGGPPILWLRGADDMVVSDRSISDPAVMGRLRLLPRWPGDTVFPPQPMLAQTRAVLKRYAANGGSFREAVVPRCGHSPHLEHPSAFLAALRSFLRSAPSAAPQQPSIRLAERAGEADLAGSA